MTVFTDTSEFWIFAEGTKGLCRPPWVRGETGNLRCVSKHISGSGILMIGILTSTFFFPDYFSFVLSKHLGSCENRKLF